MRSTMNSYTVGTIYNYNDCDGVSNTEYVQLFGDVEKNLTVYFKKLVSKNSHKKHIVFGLVTENYKYWEACDFIGFWFRKAPMTDDYEPYYVSLQNKYKGVWK